MTVPKVYLKSWAHNSMASSILSLGRHTDIFLYKDSDIRFNKCTGSKYAKQQAVVALAFAHPTSILQCP